jgi:MFS family permease
MASPRSAFGALWAAHSISTFGDALTTMTLVLLITETTHSVAAVGVLTVVVAVPGIAVGLLAGAYVDRRDRRRLMIVADLSRAGLLALLAMATLVSADLVTICVIAFLQSVVGTFFEPARAALMQVIVPADEQVRANSLVQTTTVVGELAGVTLAGFLVAGLHTYWIAFGVDAVTFAVSAGLVATIGGVATVPTGDGAPTWTAVRDGLRAVRGAPALQALVLVFGALAFALAPMAVLLAPYVLDTLGISAAWIGPILAGDTVGNIAGGVLVALFARRIAPRKLVIVGMSALAAVIASTALAGTVPALMVVHLLFGLLTVSIQTGIGAVIQTEVDNALMGRFTGLMSIVPSTVSVLAVALTGSVGAVLGVRTVLVLSGAVLAVGAGFAWHRFRYQGTGPVSAR